MTVDAGESCVVNYADGRCELIGTVDFRTARITLESVAKYIVAEKSIDIDMQRVSQSNSALLALLIEWLAQARRSGNTVRFHHIPDGIRQLARVCQVDSLL